MHQEFTSHKSQIPNGHALTGMTILFTKIQTTFTKMRYTFKPTSHFLVFGIAAATDAREPTVLIDLDDTIHLALENNREIPTT